MFQAQVFPPTYFAPEYFPRNTGPIPVPPPPSFPNIPGGAVIYAVADKISQQIEAMSATNFVPRVTVRDLNPTIFFYVGTNLSDARSITLVMTKPDGTEFFETSNVFAGTGRPTTPMGVWPPFYAVYVFGPGDIDQKGTWQAQIFWTDKNGANHASGIAVFVIYP